MIRPRTIFSGVLPLIGGIFIAGAVNAQTVYTWSAGDILTGTITPAGVTTVSASDTLNVVTANDHDFNARTVTNNGTVNWSDGKLRTGSGGSFTNNAVWNDTLVNDQFNDDYGGAGSFINAAGGIYHKISGSTVFNNIGLTNAGTVNVTGGTLSLQAGGTFTNGAVLRSSGSGVFQLIAGTLLATGNITATNFLFNGGNLAGDQTFVGSNFTWQTGTWNGANTTTIASNSTLNVASTNNHDFNTHAIVNNGTVNWTAGGLRSGNSGSIANNATWNDTSNGYTINNDYGGAGGSTFINAVGGTYNKTVGTTTFTIGLRNYGTVVVSGGVLNLDAGGTFYDGSNIGSTGTGVAQLTGGVLTAGGTGGFTATNFLLTGGQLAGNMTFLGTTNWVASNFNTAGTATVGNTGILNITTANNHDFSSHALVNNGTVNWTAGGIRSGNGGTFTNNATWNDTADGYSINNDYGGASGTTFINATAGVYNKISGTTFIKDGTLVNNGAIQVSGGQLDIAGATFNNGSSIGSSGTGLVELVGGLLTANGTINVQNFLLNGGRLTGTQTFAGTLEWRAGDLNPAGTMTIGNTSTLGITSTANHDFSGHAIVNNGTINWSAGGVRSGNGGTLTNNAIWNDTADGYTINNDYGGSGGAKFINAMNGVYNKISGTTTIKDNVLVNSGTINISGGVLNLSGATFNDGSTIGSSGPGVVQFVSGLLTANGAVNVQNFLFAGGQITGDQVFKGTLSWLGGDLNTTGTLTIGSGSTFTVDGGNNHDFSSHTIINDGTTNWLAGNLRSGNGGTVTNNGVWNDTVAGSAVNNDYGGAGGTTFLNSATGVYNKVSGGTTFQATLTNAGTINVNAGTLSLNGAFNNTGTVAVASGATLSSSNALTFAAGSVLRGSGLLSLPSLTMAGAISPGTLTAAGQLSITGDLSLLASSQALFELGGVNQGTQYDYLAVNGNVSLAGALGVRFINGFETGVTNSMTLTVMSTNALLGSFSNVANGTRISSSDNLITFVVNYGAGSPFGVNNVVLSNFVAVPEPSTWMLILTGAVAVAATCRRRLTS